MTFHDNRTGVECPSEASLASAGLVVMSSSAEVGFILECTVALWSFTLPYDVYCFHSYMEHSHQQEHIHILT